MQNLKSKISLKPLTSVIFALVLTLSVTCGCTATANNSNTGTQQNTAIEQQQQAPTNIILVRHGQTEYNVQERLQGQIDIPLNDNGMQQANALAEYLKDAKIDVAITSPLQRANVTGVAVAKRHNLDVTTDPRLME